MDSFEDIKYIHQNKIFKTIVRIILYTSINFLSNNKKLNYVSNRMSNISVYHDLSIERYLIGIDVGRQTEIKT